VPADRDVHVDGGIILIKLWLEVGNASRNARFEARIEDPLRQWKLSRMDLPSRGAGTTTRVRATK
jgi:polyphosphate kinase 2 (PPK2 family)